MDRRVTRTRKGVRGGGGGVGIFCHRSKIGRNSPDLEEKCPHCGHCG